MSHIFTVYGLVEEMAGKRSDRDASKTGLSQLLQPGSIRPVSVPCLKQPTTRWEKVQRRGNCVDQDVGAGARAMQMRTQPTGLGLGWLSRQMPTEVQARWGGECGERRCCGSQERVGVSAKPGLSGALVVVVFLFLLFFFFFWTGPEEGG